MFGGLAVLLLAAISGCHGDEQQQQDPATRMIVFRDVPKGLEVNHPQHLIIRTSYPVNDAVDTMQLC